MRRRITWLVAATTSAVVVAFIVPLCLLVQNLAQDRAVGRAREQVQSVATLVASVEDPASLRGTLALFEAQGTPVVVALPRGTAIGDDHVGLASSEAVQTARRTRSAFTRTTADGSAVVVAPVQTPRGVDVVATTVSRDQQRAGVPQAWATIIALGALLVLVAIAIARQLGRRVSIPVTNLADVAHRLRAGHLDARAVPEGPPETVELAAALNQLADRIASLVESERDAVADLAHRLRTPVTALRIDADLIAEPALGERMREHIDHLQRSIDTVVRQARRSVRDALPAPCDALEVIRRRVSFWRPLAEDQGRQLTLRCPTTPARVALSEEDVRELVDTLMDNVFTHTPEESPVEVSVEVESAASAEPRMVLTVADGGPGAAGQALRRGASGSGSSGLGLDIVRRTAEAAGGGVELRSSQLGGLAVVVSLTLSPPEAPRSPSRPRPRRGPSQSPSESR